MYNFRILNNLIFCDFPNGLVAEGSRGVGGVLICLTDHTATAKVSCLNLNNWANNLVVEYSKITVEGEVLSIEDFINWKSLNTQVGGSGSVNVDLQPVIDALENNALIEFDKEMTLGANTDDFFEITPAGSEIRDYQILETSSNQDVTSDVSGPGDAPHKLRLLTTIAITIRIIGTRTKVN